MPKQKHYRPAGKKKEGNTARFMTRSQSLKHLQINLNLFRRLCIVKGIFPREPKKSVKGNHHTYYHVKDISFLQHEPLLEKFRKIKTNQKKVLEAKAKKNEELARLLLTRQPTYNLDRLIRERYPIFIDALRDLDDSDCLTMVHLFAVLPASDREKLEVQRVHNCRRLSHEWQAYISRSHALRKVFVSVKGIYYQAELGGQKITWLTPHAIQQVFTNDVDFGVLLTFLEFYETLLEFINLILYHSLNVKYPPTLDSRLEALAADLSAPSRYIDASSRGMAVEPTVDASSSSQSNDREESELRLAQLQHHLPSIEPGALMHLVADNNKEDEETRVCKSLFKDLKFFLSREVPRESLLFVLSAFGGMVSWQGEGALFREDDESITHHIIDKSSAGHMYLSRKYVQPQWIYDCVNARIILPTEKYMVGSILPPHLSPFVDNEAEGYVPDYAETIKRLQAAARNDVLPLPGVGKEDLEDPQNLLSTGVMSIAEEAEAARNKKKMAVLEKQYHEELKMELTGSAVDVAPLVEENDASSSEKGMDVDEEWFKLYLPDLSSGMLNGKLESSYKKRANESASTMPVSSKKAKLAAASTTEEEEDTEALATVTAIDDESEDDASSSENGMDVDEEWFKLYLPDLSSGMLNEKLEPSNKKRANKSASKTHVSSKKAKPAASASTPQRTGKSVLVHCSESKANLKKQKIHKEQSEEIKDMKKSIKEMSEAIKKLQEIQTTKADLLEVSLKEKETPKKKEDSCCFECEDAKGNNYQTIFVKGFEHLRPRDEIKNALSNFFGSCGEITRVFVPMECDTRVPLGFAFINFRNCEDKEKALEVNGSYMGGRKLKVMMARLRDEYSFFTDFNGCDRCLTSIDGRRTVDDTARDADTYMNLQLSRIKERVLNFLKN